MWSSVSHHCAKARLRPYSGSMRNTPDAHHTHCLHPMQADSSCNAAGQQLRGRSQMIPLRRDGRQ